MPTVQKPFSGISLTMDQLTNVGKPISKGFIKTNKKA